MCEVMVIGVGEVGKAVFEVLKNTYTTKIRDIRPESGDECNPQVLHICYPYSESFKSDTDHYIQLYEPELVIIHSTVPPGTTSSIIGPCVHSPVIGRHPRLKQALKNFTKPVGSDRTDLFLAADNHLSKAGLKCAYLGEARASELSKILSTTYYGLCLVWHQEIARICRKMDVPFSTVSHFNKIYNEGYKGYGITVERPILDPIEWRGHCVKNNFNMLRQFWESPLLEAMEDSNSRQEAAFLVP